MPNPTISVIMPAYNAEKYINEAIDSILAQTFTDFEFIIIDDGSTDSTCAIVESYSDSRIRFFKNEHNLGVAATLNRGLDLARGEYIARMDADDISLPTRFEKQAAYMDEHQDIVVCGTAYCMFGENISEQVIECTTDWRKAKAELLFSPCVAHPSVMIRKKILENNSLRYEEKYEGTEDYVLWWRIAQYGKIAALQNILLKYRIHNEQITEIQSRDLKKRELFKSFTKERLNQLGLEPTETEIDVFFKYANGKANTYNDKEINIFGTILSKIIKQNTITHFFDHDALKKRIAIAIIECIGTNRDVPFIELLLFCIHATPYLDVLTILKGLFLRVR